VKVIFGYALASCAIACLTACGGGGGSSTAPVTNSVLQGVWSGTSSSGYALNILSLENGETYVMFGTNVGGNFAVAGFDESPISITGTAISGSVHEYDYTGATYTGSMSGTVITGTSVAGTTTYSSNVTRTFNATPISGSSYNYSLPAALVDVSGSWTGTMLNGTSATVSISSTGVITGSNSGCSFSGTALPRTSGKNVFDISVTFGSSPCALPNQNANGVAIDYMATNGLKQLLVVVQDTSKAHGTMFFAQR
jgi:hypothetical protein